MIDLMRRAGLVLAAAGLGAGASASEVVRTLAPERADFAEFRWQNRLVVLFAPAQHDTDYRAQIAALAAAEAGLAERNILVFADTDPAARGVLRQRLAGAGFMLLLIGKDGGLKRRETAPIAPEALFATIDAMPMRRREMDARD